VSTTPGILDTALQIVPLKRISPSRYASLRQCALREVWSANKQDGLLPSSPAAQLGTVIHRLLEEAGAGRFTTDTHVAVEKRWKELVDSAEEKVISSWLNRHLLPLSKVIPDFEVRRLRACKRAYELSESYATLSEGAYGKSKWFGNELWVESRDGLIGGYIDSVVASSEGPIIRDFKSGSVVETAPLQSLSVLKSEYVVQLKLYAALYATLTGTWPAKLELVPLQGEPLRVPYDPAECLALLEDASRSLQKTNEVILSRSQAPRRPEEYLANPHDSHCRFCPFRPSCSAYQRYNADAHIAVRTSHDIIGTLVEIRALGNSTLLISVEASGEANKVKRVRNLTPNSSRHPALGYLQKGDRVGLFNLKFGGSEDSFIEIPLTTIYKIILCDELYE
jgi:RecB family exonuclease